jgi:hypothetical protein
MPGRTTELPKSGFALEIDGRLKTEFSTREGAERGAIELKRRFPLLQIRIYDADTQTRQRFSRLSADGPAVKHGSTPVATRADGIPSHRAATSDSVSCAARTTASALMSNFL